MAEYPLRHMYRPSPFATVTVLYGLYTFSIPLNTYVQTFDSFDIQMAIQYREKRFCSDQKGPGNREKGIFL
jgi:hypothetical protein